MGDYEHREQSKFVSWVRDHEIVYPELITFHSIPNAGKRSFRTASWMKAEGLRKGALDTNLPVARGKYHGLWIEFKTPGEDLSKEQTIFAHALQKEGQCVVVAYSADQAQKVLLHYLKLGRPTRLICRTGSRSLTPAQ